MHYSTNYSNPQLTQTPSSKKAIKWFEQYGETELWESIFTQSITPTISTTAKIYIATLSLIRRKELCVVFLFVSFFEAQKFPLVIPE